MPKLNVLVTGATGKQGGAVARALLKKGHVVHALTRKPDSPAAKELARAAAKIVKGDLADLASLERAMKGVDAVFAVSTPFEAGMDAEVKQGTTLADAAKAAGVKHLVYTSVGSADQKTGIPHFESKSKVEQHIRSLGIPATVLGPVYFMENAITFGLDQLKQGRYAVALPPDRKLAQVALADIGAFGALVIENRDQFIGKRVDLVSDDLTGAQCAEILSKASGKKIQYFQVPIQMVRSSSEDLAKMYEWFNRVGYSVDPAALRRDYPQVGWHTYESWAREQDWKKILG